MRATLRTRALRAGGWSVAGYGLGLALRLGSNLIMTRLLVPEMFGVMAIATMVAVVLHMLSDFGVTQNIVQSRRGDEPSLLDTAWTLQILRGFALWAIALLLSAGLYAAAAAGAVPAGSVYASPVLPAVIAVNAFAAVILGFQSTKMATAHRSFEQRRINQISLVSQVIALAVMVPLGIVSRSIWALVAGGLVAALLTTVLSHAWIPGRGNRLLWDKDAYAELMHFGKWVFVSSALGVLASNGDRILLGSFVDAETLGVYSIAALIVGAIEGVWARLVLTVALPALSEVAREDRARLRDVYYRLRLPGDVALLAAAGFLFAAGQLLVDVLYDARYSAAGGMLQILAVSLFGVRYSAAIAVYLALGLPRYVMLMNAARVIALYGALPVMYYAAGVQAAIWAIALHWLVVVPVVHVVNYRLQMNDTRRECAVLAALPAGLLAGYALLPLVPGAS